MGNAACQYPSGVPKAARLSWTNAEGVPRIFTPWDVEDCPGVDLYDGLDLPKKAVRFLLGDPAQIPASIPTSPQLKRCHSEPTDPKGILKNSHIIIKQPPKRRHRRVRSLTRRISNSKVEVIPYYFTKRGVPATDHIVGNTVGNNRRPSTEENDQKSDTENSDCKEVETARRPSIDILEQETKTADPLQGSLESYSSDNIEQAENLFSELNLQTLKQECFLSEKLSSMSQCNDPLLQCKTTLSDIVETTVPN